MTFAEPMLLWGALAVAVPVALHFWHRSRGTLRPWAATQWLAEVGQPPSRGLRLNQLVLLLIRCLGLLVLVALLSGPRFGTDETTTEPRVHLVQPSSVVTANFRFELTRALARNEPVFWISDPPRATDDLRRLPAQPIVNRRVLQSALNTLRRQNTELHLYVINQRALADGPVITVPARFRLHAAPDMARPRPAYLRAKNGQTLFVDESGRLTSAPEPAGQRPAVPVRTGSIRVRLAYRNPRETQTVRAALSALTDVYGVDLTFDSTARLGADWVLTDQLPTRPEPRTLYVVSGSAPAVPAANVVWSPEPLTAQTSARVRSGRLPEWLAEPLLAHYGLTPSPAPLSRRELAALFVTDPQPVDDSPAAPARSGLSVGLTALFIGLLTLERWLALSRTT